jgi:hypothetical protein
MLDDGQRPDVFHDLGQSIESVADKEEHVSLDEGEPTS